MPPNDAITVGIAVPTTVASSAAINIPVITPTVTAQRRREDISSSGVASLCFSDFPSTLVRSFSYFNFYDLISKSLAILFPKLADLQHQMIADLFVRAQRIALFVEFGKIDRLAEPNTNLFTAGPVSQDLFRQIVAETDDKNRNDLRSRRHNDFPG